MRHFRVAKAIGSGGFAHVDEVAVLDADGQTVLLERVARKTLDAVHASDPEALERFRREVQLQEELAHPNIIEILGRDLAAQPPYFLMPVAEATLHQRLRAGRAGDVPWVLNAFAEILGGMAHAHTRKEPVVHRDIKPRNILFVAGIAKVADFGLGKRVAGKDSSLTATDVGMGTEAYMAPEQFGDAKHVGPPADVYALGKMLWEMFTGKPPEVLYVDLDMVPREFRWFIDKCTRRRPEQRYLDAADALSAFRLFTAAATTTDPPVDVAERLITAWTQAVDGKRREIIRELDDHLARHRAEEELYLKLLPRLPEDLVEAYSHESRENFLNMLRVYDDHISGALPFSYCDVVADLYGRLWRRSDDLHLRRLILVRLIRLGASHNRWYVGETVGSLLGTINDVPTALMAAEVVQSLPEDSEWFWTPWIRDIHLPAALSTAFSAVIDETS